MVNYFLALLSDLPFLVLGAVASVAALSLSLGFPRPFPRQVRTAGAMLCCGVVGYCAAVVLHQGSIADLSAQLDAKDRELQSQIAMFGDVQKQLFERQKVVTQLTLEVDDYAQLLENRPELRCSADPDFTNRLRSIQSRLPGPN